MLSLTSEFDWLAVPAPGSAGFIRTVLTEKVRPSGCFGPVASTSITCQSFKLQSKTVHFLLQFFPINRAEMQ